MIDFKGGVVMWNTMSDIDPARPPEEQDLSEDLLSVKYNNVDIDMGWHQFCFCITVIKPNDIDGDRGWLFPIARILCFTIEDMLAQLQRAIDLYTDKTW